MKKTIKIGDKISWRDIESGMRKTGIIEEISDVVSVSNKFDIEDPYAKINFKDLNEKSYEVRCDNDNNLYSFLEGDWDGEIIKSN